MKYHVLAAISLAFGSTVVLAQEQEDATPSETEAAAAAPAQAAVPEEAVDPEAEEPDPGEEVVCRRERVTGSLTRIRRTCMTRNEWNDVEARTRDALNETNRGASGGVECRIDQFGGC